MEASELIHAWLEVRLAPAAREWLDGRREELATRYTDRALHITLGMIPRRLGKDDLAPTMAELEAAGDARPGWDPDLWGIADAARVLVLLETVGAGNQGFHERFADLCRSAEVGELIALYRGLALYPSPESLETQAGEGLRTNMRSVFEAVAHRNPYPREQFSQDRWNHMVLKALFIDSTLAPIQGLDERANEELARILCDYAHERWAAHRAVTPELWRCVGPFARGEMLDDLARVLASEVATEREAAALALAASPDAQAARILDTAPDLRQQLDTGALTWHGVASTAG